MPRIRKCCVRECNNNNKMCNLFIWPKNEQTAQKWCRNLGFEGRRIAPSNTFVCAIHFEDYAVGTKRLKDGAVPTLNLENIEFDASLSEEERRFYLRAYPSVDLVRERKVHCTVCKTHIGTAPSQEENIRMHPVLRVTHCLKCHDFYNSGEFSKGEDGSELYCRWCGQGGEVYCCSSCPYVFCKSCIVKNLSRGVVVDIEQNENWNCFSCAPKILWPLRAQHWALIRYIEKQKKYIEVNHTNETEKRALLSQDRSTCCRLAKSKCGNMSDSMESLDSATSRRSQSSSSTKKHSKSPGSHPQAPPAKRMKNSNDEVVCTPDLLSMLEPDCQITVQQKTRPAPSPITSTPKIISLQTHSPNSSGITLKPHNNTPPPLVLRNTGIPIRHPSPAPIVRRTIIGARNAPITGNHTPVYHTINGYRIDLNSAAQQETFRLPNGKLIQVKRQGTNQPQPTTTPSPSNAWMRQASPITAIQHAASGRPVQITPARTYYSVSQQHQQNSMQQPQMIRYSNTTVTPVSGQNGAIRGTQIQLINGVPVAPTATPATVNSATAVRTPVMVRHVFPDTAIGQARSQLQDQVFNAMEICQHLTGKVQTLTNSNAYKQARNYLEVKELYIHLSYLLTYAIGRFKGLQDKCLGDMRQLGFVNDADSLENGQLAAGVDYVRYGQLEDIDLFNTSANSFHNQVYEYRKSLYANMENGEGVDKKPPLSPLMPLGQLKRGGADGDDDEDYGENDEIGDNSWMKNTLDEPTNQTYYDDGVDMTANEDVDATADADGDDEENDADADGAADFEQYVAQQQQTLRYSNKAHYGTEDYMSQEEQTHARDRKLARLIEKYPAIWCTRHPDYGNFEVTRKYWRIVAAHFKRTENIKLRWKNIRKRYVRVERRIRDGKRFNGYFDKTTNFLANRDLPEDQWVEVDCGSDDDEAQHIEHKKPTVIEKSTLKDDKLHDWNNDDSVADAEDYETSSGVKALEVQALEVRALDLKIVNFVKCNPVLWRKSGDSQYNSIDVQSRNSLWMHLWRSLRSQSSMLNDLNCEDIMDRWSHLYEMYKSFRLKTIKSEIKRANLELKYSKYLAKLSFLYKIVEEDLRNEHLENIDIDFMQEVTENDSRLQDEPDDKEFMLQLVRAVQRYPLLWDKLNVDYYDQVLRSKYWQYIASELKDFKHKQASDDEDNEIEIVEPKTDTITLDSDNEDEEPAKQTDTPETPQLITIITTAPSSKSACHISPEDNRQKLILKEQLTLPKGTTIVPTTPVPSLTKLPSLSNSNTITIKRPNDNNKMEEVDMMSAAKKFLVSLLEVDSDGGEQQQQRKQPRKKTTNKPNPTLLKQKEMLERERLEEMKRNDLKLKMKCAISLKKAEEEYPFARDMLQQHENESKTEMRPNEAQSVASTEEQLEVAESTDDADTKELNESDEAGNENDSGDMEILTVDLESSIDEGKETEIVLDGEKSPAQKCVEVENNGNGEKYTIVMDDEDEGKEKSLIIEVEGNSSSEKQSLEVVIDENTANSNDDSNEKCTKTKMETVSECAKRVIEGLQASEKQKEIEKNEQQQTKMASPDTASSVDNASADDIIEPIVFDESDVADSEDSPIKQSGKVSEVTNEHAVITKNPTESASSDDVLAARREATTKSGLVACAIKAATESETNAVELNEPEIDVEKEIEMLLMKKAQLPEAETNTNTEVTSTAADMQAGKAPITQAATPELLSDLADNLLESANTTNT